MKNYEISMSFGVTRRFDIQAEDENDAKVEAYKLFANDILTDKINLADCMTYKSIMCHEDEYIKDEFELSKKDIHYSTHIGDDEHQKHLRKKYFDKINTR